MKTGFTLIELLVVVLIIAVLAAIALPQYQLAVHKAKISRYMPIARAFARAQDLYYMENGHFAMYTEDLMFDLPDGCTSETHEKWASQIIIKCKDFGLIWNHQTYDNLTWTTLTYPLARYKDAKPFNIPSSRAIKFAYLATIKPFCGVTSHFPDLERKICKALGGVKISEAGTVPGEVWELR